MADYSLGFTISVYGFAPMIGGIISSLASKDGYRSKWYKELKKSSLNPSFKIFPVVWTMLYLLLGASFVLFLKGSDTLSTSTFVALLVLYCVQMVLNWLWSPVFFGAKNASLALVMIQVMFGCVFSLVLLSTLQTNSLLIYLSGYMQIPYLCWLLFAGYLNFYVVQHNK